MTRLASLQNRIFFASAALALITIALAVYLVQLRLTRETETEIERSLMQARRLVEQQHQTLSSQFLLVARLVADLPVLKAAVETQDPATVAPIAREYERTLGADLFRLTGRDGRQLFVTADSPVPGAGADEAPPPVEETAAFWRHPRGILQVVTVPIVIGRQSPDLLGTLTAGFLLDAHRADQIKAATASDIGFALDGELLASTVRPAAAPRLEQVTSASGVTRLRLGGEDWVATGVPLVLPLAPAGTAPASQPVVVVLRSRTVELRALRSINAALLTAGAIAVGLAIVLSYAVARYGVASARGSITGRHARDERARATSRGKSRACAAGGAWEDEDTRLLASHVQQRSTASLARFQREAAERDRLAALGRLSTVIAHEVRNPADDHHGRAAPDHAPRTRCHRPAGRRHGHRRGSAASEPGGGRRARLRASAAIRSGAHRRQRGVHRGGRCRGGGLPASTDRTGTVDRPARDTE
jgi:hypothetical protein